MRTEETLEHFIRFTDGSASTYVGSIESVMKEIEKKDGSRDATDVHSRIISKDDGVLGIGCSNNLFLLSTRAILVEAVDHARSDRYAREHPRLDLGIPLWEAM